MGAATEIHSSTLLEVIEKWSAKDRVALISPGAGSTSYADLLCITRALADSFRDAGIETSDRVAVALDNSADSASLLLAVMSCGICCPVDPALRAAEIGVALDQLAPVALVATQGIAGTARRSAAERGMAVFDLVPAAGWNSCPVLELVSKGQPDAWRQARATAGKPRFSEIAILRTSGTTGQGKLVPLSARTILAGADATCAAYRLTSEDRRLNVMPFHHVQGLEGSLVASLRCGSSVVCVAAFDPASTLDLLSDHDVTWYSGSPTMHRRILDARDRGAEQRLERLRFIRSGSASLPPALRDELVAAFGVPVVESYGMTEAHQIASTPLPPAPPAAGLVLTGSRAAILDAAGGLVTEPGRSGEIVIRGDNVIPGYLAAAKDNDPCFADGWFRTGDAGSFAPDGSLLIEGRIKDLIIRGGEKIIPQEVEQVLTAHPGIEQAAVFGIAHVDLTEQVAAAVIPVAGARLDLRDVRRFAAERIAPYKVPAHYLICAEFPLTATGKVVRADLAERLASGHQASGEDVGLGAPADAPPAHMTPRERAEGDQSPALMAALSGLWAAALGADPVAPDADFFALGGDSLSAATLLRMVSDALGAEFSPLALYDEVNTVARMAAAIQARRAGTESASEGRL